MSCTYTNPTNQACNVMQASVHQASVYLSGFGFRVQGLGFRGLGLGLRVWGLGFRVQGLGFRLKAFHRHQVHGSRCDGGLPQGALMRSPSCFVAVLSGRRPYKSIIGGLQWGDIGVTLDCSGVVLGLYLGYIGVMFLVVETSMFFCIPDIAFFPQP